jgi:hypothetical protein
MEVTKETLQESVEFIAEATPILQKQAELETRIAERAPEVVDLLIKAGHVAPEIRETAVKNLQDPMNMLTVLSKLAALTGQKKEAAVAPATMGEAVTTNKQASAPARADKESDKAFLRGFGLA